MVIVVSGSGNHSNRLFQNIHFEAFCKEYGLEYLNPSFNNMHKYYKYPCELTKGLKGVVFLNNIIFKILRKTNILEKRLIPFNNEHSNDIKRLLPPIYDVFHKDAYVYGWHFRIHELTEKYQDYFIKKYTLKNKYIKGNKLLNKINYLKDGGQIVIGIHIRRGDYRYWEGGKYYFEDDVYLKYMKAISENIEATLNKKCSFIIFSNENILLNKKFNQYNKSQELWYIDHYLMSKCDYLIGPPSTFTMWASYIGKTKYFHIKDDSGKIKLCDFTFCNG